MKPPPNFNRLAGAYFWMEKFTFGNLLWKCRCVHLDSARSCKTALILGDGDGRFTAQLLKLNPHVRIDAVDNSSAMLGALLRRTGPNRDRVRTHLADARSFIPPLPTYDLVATHFFLDCLTTHEVYALATRLQRCLLPSSTWIISDFAVPNSRFGSTIALPLVTALYLAFALLTQTRVFRLPDHRCALASAGFAPRSTALFLSGLLFSEVWIPSQGLAQAANAVSASMLKSSF